MIQNLKIRFAIIGVVLALGAFFVYPSVGPVPEWWAKYLPNSPIRLGLDLQGGLHLMLEVQAEAAVEAEVDKSIQISLGYMKEEGVLYKDAKRISPTSFIVIVNDPEQAGLFDAKVAEKLINFKRGATTQTPQGVELEMKFDEKRMAEIRKLAVRQAVDTIRNRVDQFGVAEPDVVMHGEDRILVQLPGLREDINRAVDIIQKTARLEFKLVDDKGNLAAAQAGDMPEGDEILYQIDKNLKTGTATRTPLLLKKRVLMTGADISDAHMSIDDRRGAPYVSLEFNRAGAALFEQITSQHVRDRLAIVLDGRVYSAPVIQERISGGRAQITGNFSSQEAGDLALVLRAGSLPAPVKILENRTVGPSLGEDSIRLGRNALLLGMFLTVFAMALYYKWSGLVADIALTMNLLLILAIMASPWLRATLTLPGLAGIALTIGMAVDANILIFERVREELRMGKSPRAALEAGYTKAFSTILDSNLTTILSALPLIQFGTGPIKGFAVTLVIGLLISMFTALFVTRAIFDYMFEVRRIKHVSV